MDLGRYKTLKRMKLITLQLVGDQVIVISKRFDAGTGMELKAETLPVDVESLNEQKELLEKQLGEITEFLDDIRKVGS